jgi:hypothetical protein
MTCQPLALSEPGTRPIRTSAAAPPCTLGRAAYDWHRSLVERYLPGDSELVRWIDSVDRKKSRVRKMCGRGSSRVDKTTSCPIGMLAGPSVPPSRGRLRHRVAPPRGLITEVQKRRRPVINPRSNEGGVSLTPPEASESASGPSGRLVAPRISAGCDVGEQSPVGLAGVEE